MPSPKPIMCAFSLLLRAGKCISMELLFGPTVRFSYFSAALWGLIVELKMCLKKTQTNMQSRKVPAMPAALLLMLLGEFAMAPDRTVSDSFIIWRVCYRPSEAQAAIVWTVQFPGRLNLGSRLGRFGAETCTVSGSRGKHWRIAEGQKSTKAV